MEVVDNNFHLRPDCYLSWFFSEEASNVGAFVSGCCDVIFVFLAIWTLVFEIRKWRKEKRTERLSDIAEEALSRLESCINKATTWLNKVYFVYSGCSSASTAQYEIATPEQKLELQKMHKEHPYELNNYCAGFEAIIDEFVFAKNRAERLENSDVNKCFEDLEVVLKKIPIRVARVYKRNFSNAGFGQNEVIPDWDFLENEAPKEIVAQFENIKKSLYKYIKFDKKAHSLF